MDAMQKIFDIVKCSVIGAMPFYMGYQFPNKLETAQPLRGAVSMEAGEDQ